jgi:membrane protein DedA with SNARE-associated domain
VISVATAAVFLGSSLLYAAMRRGGRAALARYGRFVRLPPQRVERMERWFLRRGRLAVFLGRLIPGLRIPTTVMAGLSGMPYHRFVGSALPAALIWSGEFYLLGWAARRAGPPMAASLADALDDVPRAVLLLGALLTLAGAVGGATLHAWRRRQRSHRAHL